MAPLDPPSSQALSSDWLDALVAASQARAGRASEASTALTALIEGAITAAGVVPGAGDHPVDAVQAAVRQAAVELARHRAHLAALQQARSQAQEREQRARELGRQAARLEVLAGHLRSDRFVEFLLSESVEQIARVASGRLFELSAGRYSLGVECEGSGAFRVIDHHNADEPRGVETLSGGETFQASLALALALSEGLANLSGDTRLDAVFIDEGFASLDAESLDLAIDALESVHAGGRMVGVITHLPQMAERIPEGLEVVKGEAGSRIVRRAA